MRIQSVRLKNIKSYGEGPYGNGITVGFEPGVNRVAGRNGHGKTTLIEALGYALFFSEPEHEETFQLKAYFLRAGEREGEIDVVFALSGESYRVERALGQNKRRSKVVQLSDGSTCAEGDEAVAGFLCRILAAEQRKLSPNQLSDLFSNLIGVKQGRLAWPFDSKPAAAKEFFEPLLDVAIFRESEGRLKEARNKFEDLAAEQALKLAVIRQRIEDLAGSRDAVPVKEAEVDAWRKTVEKTRRLKDETEKQKQACEQKQAAFNKAREELNEANSQWKLASQKHQQDQRQVAEAQAAAETVQKTQPGYDVYLKAEEALRQLQKQQSEKSALLTEREKALQARSQAEAKRGMAQRQLQILGGQRDERGKQAQTLRKQLAVRYKTVAEIKTDCARLNESNVAAKVVTNELSRWLESLPEAADQPPKEYDVAPVLKAGRDEQMCREALRGWESKLAKAETGKQSLAAQLAQIAGGMCPFLKEKCRQFDPNAVQNDLLSFEKEIVQAEHKRRESAEAHSRAKADFAEAKAKLLKEANDRVEQSRARFEGRDRERIAIERDLKNEETNLGQVERALKELSQNLQSTSEDVARTESEVQAATRNVAEVEQRLAKFASLDTEVAAQQAVRDTAAKDHQIYLQHHRLAAMLDSFKAACTSSLETEKKAHALVRLRTEDIERTRRDFEPEALQKAQEAAADARSKLVADERELANAQNELKKEKERLAQWKQACEERDLIENESSRQLAAAQLARIAGKILKEAAPAVAQHLCSRIAVNAQRIFNQINQEPIELEWKAEPHYSLRIVPGSRRFAMLSGGEQTKLALAMTLAMIQEFSGLHFAVFDEPTYAVDSESRQKLADAILEAQKAAGLEQLIVVSHDDAFEGKIENVVMLRKTAAGTELVTAV